MAATPRIDGRPNVRSARRRPARQSSTAAMMRVMASAGLTALATGTRRWWRVNSRNKSTRDRAARPQLLCPAAVYLEHETGHALRARRALLFHARLGR